MSLLGKIKNLLFKCDEDKNRIKLDTRIDIRVNHKEKELMQSFCNLQGITLSDLIRNASLKYIDNFIKVGE